VIANAAHVLDAIRSAATIRGIGRVEELSGSILRARGAAAVVGEICHVLAADGERLGDAVVVGFRGDHLVLTPFDELGGLAPGCGIEPTGRPLGAPVGEGLLGRVVDALGRPIDGGGALRGVRTVAVDSAPRSALARPRIGEVLVSGIRAVDAAITLGKGQRVGVFAGSGVGKSTVLGMLARGTGAERCVIALVGERAREVKEFIDDALGEEGLRRSVVVVTTSDEPAVRKVHAVATACRIAEQFRDQGRDVMLLVDSITRVAYAQREIGLAAGEPPTTRGYTPSVFALLPKILERAGTSPSGSITGIYTVLVEGDDLDEPVADHMRSVLDGHIVLSRTLAHRHHYPAIDLLGSKSRVMGDICGDAHLKLDAELRRTLATYAEIEDLVRIGAYRAGGSADVDRAVRLQGSIMDFLAQDRHRCAPFDETLAELARLLAIPAGGAS